MLHMTWTVFHVISNPNRAVSLHADTVVLPCLSDHSQRNHPPTTHHSTVFCFSSNPFPTTTTTTTQPIPFPETCPIKSQSLLPAWVCSVSELATPSQRLPPPHTHPPPPHSSSCVLWQHHVSTATVDDVRMPHRRGHPLLSLSSCLSLSTDSTGCWSVHSLSNCIGDVSEFL